MDYKYHQTEEINSEYYQTYWQAKDTKYIECEDNLVCVNLSAELLIFLKKEHA